MSDTSSRAEPRGAVRERRPGGARAAGGSGARRRRAGLWPLLAALAALAVIGILLAALLSGGSSSKHKAAAGANGNTNSAAGSTGAAANGGSGAGSNASASQAGGAAAALPPSGLIGGGGIAARPASGALAAPGAAGAILFAEAGTALDQHARAVVVMAAKEIKARHAHSVNVIGYTDTLGNRRANVTLSLNRAQVVAAALQRQLDGFTVQYHAKAQGQSHPVAPNTTAQGRQLNRRVVIFMEH